MSCVCGSIGAPDVVRQCPEHFHLWKGDRRLASVGSIIRTCWPPVSIPADVLENARDRGSEVDALFAAYVLGKLTRIPAGTRHDARDLFLKLVKWYDSQNFKDVAVQVVLGDSDHGGVMDFRFDGVPVDLKCTYKVEETARLQTAAYSFMCDAGGVGAVLHVTERYPEPRWVQLTLQDADDWQVMLRHWRMLQRRLSQ